MVHIRHRSSADPFGNTVQSLATPASHGKGLRGLTRGHRSALTLAGMLGMAASAAALVQPLIVQSLLSAVMHGRATSGLALGLAVAFSLSAVLQGVRTFLLGRLGERILFEVRVRLADRLLRMPVSAHDARSAGDLISRVTLDTEVLRAALTTAPLAALTGAVTFVGALILMAILDWLLLGITLMCVAIAFVGIALVIPAAKHASAQAQASLGRVNASLERSLRSIRTVKASRAEERELNDITAQAEEVRVGATRLARVQAFIDPAVLVAVQGSLLIVLGVGGARVASGDLAVPALVAFLLYLTLLIVPLSDVFRFLSEVQKAQAALERIQSVLDIGPEPEPEPAEAAAASVAWVGTASSGAIRFEAVSFDYGGPPVLDGVSFEAAPASLTAIVGSSGAGKTSLLSLVERFYEPLSGVILLDGVDIRQIPLNELRRRVAYVAQDTPILAGTLAENLRYANPDADDVAIAGVLSMAGLQRFVDRLPAGLDTEVGDSGVRLSGGERQRIAVARALLATPECLLLDEVTSQLDSVNERALRETIDNVARSGCTVIVVAHRLSTVIDAERIVLLDAGRVLRVGTHEELLSNEVVYRRFVEGQFSRATGIAGSTGPAP